MSTGLARAVFARGVKAFEHRRDVLFDILEVEALFVVFSLHCSQNQRSPSSSCGRTHDGVEVGLPVAVGEDRVGFLPPGSSDSSFSRGAARPAKRRPTAVLTGSARFSCPDVCTAGNFEVGRERWEIGGEVADRSAWSVSGTHEHRRPAAVAQRFRSVSWRAPRGRAA